MKINNDVIKALQQATQSGEAHRKPKVGEDGFDALLARQLQGGDAKLNAEPALAAAKAEEAALLMATAQQLGGVAGEEGVEENLIQDALRTDQAAARVSGLLDQWEQYAGALKGPQSDLKAMYGLLQGMTREVAEIKGSGLAQGNEALGAMLNELDVLTTTETIKFNRGDYL